MAAGSGAQLGAELEQACDILAARRKTVGRRLDDVVKAQPQPTMRRKFAECVELGMVRVEDRQHVRDPGGAMLAEFRNAADRHPKRCQNSSPFASFQPAERSTEAPSRAWVLPGASPRDAPIATKLGAARRGS